MKKIGIITFHNSYNCGSMLESFAILKIMQKIDSDAELIDFSSQGQKNLYKVFFKCDSMKNIIKNCLLLPHYKRIKNNNSQYESFKKNNFKLSKEYCYNSELSDEDYSVVVAGSDQIWNITIDDYDDAYFLNWVVNSKKVAYAPSFGAKNILKYSDNPEKYSKLISEFSSLSIREENGKKWIKDLTNLDAELLIDPTLLLDCEEYEKIMDDSCTPNEEYIFLYCPGFLRDLCDFVKKVSVKYDLPVIAWSAKSYYTKAIYTYGFKLPKYESPSVYLSLIKNAKIVFTTSFHGTIFSTIFKKVFFTLKNGGMYGDDDRVRTLLKQLHMENRLLEPNYDSDIDFLKQIDYSNYDLDLTKLRERAFNYIEKNIGEINE